MTGDNFPYATKGERSPMHHSSDTTRYGYRPPITGYDRAGVSRHLRIGRPQGKRPLTLLQAPDPHGVLTAFGHALGAFIPHRRHP